MRMALFYATAAAASSSCVALRSGIVRLPATQIAAASARTAGATRLYMSTKQSSSSKEANGEVTRQSLQRKPRISEDMKQLLLDQVLAPKSKNLECQI
jgi:hypothetical protein